MYYITVRQHQKEKQLTWMDLINDADPTSETKRVDGSAGTITRAVEAIKPELIEKANTEHIIYVLKKFNERYKDLHDADKRTLYRHFTLPKKSGGKRPIDAPKENLRLAQSELRYILKEECGLLYHTAAFAYVKKRSTKHEVMKHQKNVSNWFLKTDFSGFFPSTTLDFAMRMLSMVFPLSEVCKREDGYDELKKALSIGFLNGGLPQGSTLSPDLTNMICIPMDYALFNELAKHRFVYTRYADDIHISCIQKFNPEKTIKLIESVLKQFNAPWKIKPEKTTFGTNKGSGANWLLGCMLNKDNNITVGWRNRELFRAKTANLIMDYKNKKSWPVEEVQKYEGLRSYYQMVDKEYITNLIKKYNKKFHVDLKVVVKTMMNRH